MGTIIVFIVVMIVLAYWWLWQQRIFEKPWATEGVAADPRDDIGSIGSASKTGLTIFLAVVTSLFSLFISAYFMRMQLPDWHPVDEPGLLWFNTALLIIGSISIHVSHRAAVDGNASLLRMALVATGIFTVGFIAGQFVAWQQLADQGYYLRSNPANAFFYLFTALHGLHLAGGLWVWLGATVKSFTRTSVSDINLSVQLCAIYWHFLLVVWLVLLGLLMST